MRKRIRVMAIFLLVLVFAGCAAGNREDAPGTLRTVAEMSGTQMSCERDGVLHAVVTVTSAVVEEGSVSIVYTVTNETEIQLTVVELYVDFLDEQGKTLNTKPLQLLSNFRREPLDPGKEVQIDRIYYFEGAENAVQIREVSSRVETIETMGMIRDPQPNNYLLDFCGDDALRARFESLDEELPVMMLYRNGEDEEIRVTDQDTIRQVTDALQKVYIGEETDISITDSAVTFSFFMEDGSQWAVGFEHPSIFNWQGKNYEVVDSAGLFRIKIEP